MVNRRKDAHQPQRAGPGSGAPRPVDNPPAPRAGRASDTSINRELRAEISGTVRRGRLDEALEKMEKAIDAFEAQRYAEAAELALEVKNLAHRSPAVRELLGLSYYRLDRWREAATELLTYGRLSGRRDQNHVIADCYRALGRSERAVEVAREIRESDVDEDRFIEGVIVAASALADQGNFRGAIAELKRASLNPPAVQPHHLRLWYVHADLLERAGRKGEAMKWWEAVAAEDPNFFDVQGKMAQG